jgi:putative DNA primase/helicase
MRVARTGEPRKFDRYEAEQQFKDFLSSQSLAIKGSESLIADGEWHRCDATNKEGNSGRSDGKYLLRLDGWPAGGAINWTRGGRFEKWKYKPKGGVKLSEAERAEIDQRMQEARAKAVAERKRLEQEAKQEAERLWRIGLESDQHGYLVKKKIKAYGAKVWNGELLVPMMRDGEMVGLQRIMPDGFKCYLTGTRPNGCYYAIEKAEGDDGQTICICEGYATGATIAEATGHQVVIAFAAGNLITVAKVMREQYPDARIIVCADDDWKTEGNPGIKAAKAAASAVSALVAVPDFKDLKDDDRGTDFNDLRLRQRYGLWARGHRKGWGAKEHE